MQINEYNAQRFQLCMDLVLANQFILTSSMQNKHVTKEAFNNIVFAGLKHANISETFEFVHTTFII